MGVSPLYSQPRVPVLGVVGTNPQTRRYSHDIRRILEVSQTWSAYVYSANAQPALTAGIIGFDTLLYDYYTPPGSTIRFNPWSQGSGPASYPFSTYTTPQSGIYGINFQLAFTTTGAGGAGDYAHIFLESGSAQLATSSTLNLNGLPSATQYRLNAYFEGFLDQGAVITVTLGSTLSFTPQPGNGHTFLSLTYRGPQ